jgi:hypothetical protein
VAIPRTRLRVVRVRLSNKYFRKRRFNVNDRHDWGVGAAVVIAFCINPISVHFTSSCQPWLVAILYVPRPEPPGVTSSLPESTFA